MQNNQSDLPNDVITPEQIAHRSEVEADYRAVLTRCGISDDTMAGLSEDLSMAMWVFFVHGHNAGKNRVAIIPKDFVTHQDAWRSALLIADQHAVVVHPDQDDKLYWQHEIEAFDRAYAELGEE